MAIRRRLRCSVIHKKDGLFHLSYRKKNRSYAFLRLLWGPYQTLSAVFLLKDSLSLPVAAYQKFHQLKDKLTLDSVPKTESNQYKYG